MSALFTNPSIKFIILDIDGTLIDGNTPETIVERPHLDIFIRTLFHLFEGRVGIWTSAKLDWLYHVHEYHLKSKIPEPYTQFKFLLHRDHCEKRNIFKAGLGWTPIFVKPLRLLRTFPIRSPDILPTEENTLIVDDNMDTFVDNPHQAIWVDRFIAFNSKREIDDRIFVKVITQIRQIMTNSTTS